MYTDEEGEEGQDGFDGQPDKLEHTQAMPPPLDRFGRAFQAGRRKEFMIVMGIMGVLALATLGVLLLREMSQPPPLTTTLPAYATPLRPDQIPPPHPIDILIEEASKTVNNLLFSHPPPADVSAAAQEYRKIRGRHPPPGFERWFEWAKETGSFTMEWLFDQVYEDIEPFWGLPAAEIRADAASWAVVLALRDGEVTRRRAMPPVWLDRDLMWQIILREIPVGALPDMDIPLNLDDTAHIFVPWEDMAGYMEAASHSRVLRPANEMSAAYAKYPPIENATMELFPDAPSEENLWLLLRDTCPPWSEARNLTQDTDFTLPANFPSTYADYMEFGYISNWTAAMSPCENPDLRNLHGYFVNFLDGSRMHWADPDSKDRLVTRKLFPVFSSSKIRGSNNDILIPSASDWSVSYFAEDALPWSEKAHQAVWRGAATGGTNNDTNWTRFHRHRLVSMLNGTQVGMTQRSPIPPEKVPGGDPLLPHNFPLPNSETYPIGALQSEDDLGRWIGTFANVSFTMLFCFPLTDYVKNNNGTICGYNSHYYHSDEGMPMEDFFNAKYLPDTDGHGYSGRYRAFLHSYSVPIKATIWQEWSTSRLFAWEHFVPMDGTFVDLYGIMDYFLGYTPPEGSDVHIHHRNGHDEAAKKIAVQGHQWARKVLRHDDMVLYTWRLLLEYARVCDDNRDSLGWVEDLL